MLPQVSRLQSRISYRGRWCLFLWSLAMFGLPTWLVTARSQEIKPRVTPPLTVKPAAPAVAASESATMEFFPELSRKEQKILRELEMPTTFDFTDETLKGIADTLMQRHGFDIVIDKPRLEENSVAVDATDISVKVSEVSLRSALRLALRQKNLGYVIEDDVLMITTAEASEAGRITRTYPVQDLTGESPGDFPALMEAIKQGVTPGSWRESADLGYGSGVPHSAPGGFGNVSPAPPTFAKSGNVKASDLQNTISMVPASGSLVIRQSWRGHDEVLTLLRALRKAKARPATP